MSSGAMLSKPLLLAQAAQKHGAHLTSHSAVEALHIAAAATAAAEAAASSGEAAAAPPLAAPRPVRQAAEVSAVWPLGAGDPAAQTPSPQNALRALLNTSFVNR